jgi:hypothetical protein
VAATPTEADVAGFVRDTFGSVWALEVLLVLKRDSARSWPRPELVAALRASDSVVDSSIARLLACGLVLVDEAGSARYVPAAPSLEGLVAATEALYAQKPDSVRRWIILPRHDGLSAFSDAFRLRKDK